MIHGNRRAGSGRLKTGAVFVLCTGVAACASMQPGRAPMTDFNGTWSAKWCDQAYPESECGNFVLHLIQRGERICGQHYAATPRLSKLEEGEPGSVLGTAVGNTAVLLVSNARSGDRDIATATLTRTGLQWHVVGVAAQGEWPGESIIGGDRVLDRDTSPDAMAAWRALNEAPCQWPDEVPPGVPKSS
jgi:hypothetical protein